MAANASAALTAKAALAVVRKKNNIQNAPLKKEAFFVILVLENLLRLCQNVLLIFLGGIFMETLAYMLSLLGLVCVITSSLIKGRRMGWILLFLCSGNALVATSYLLSASYAGAASCFIGAGQALINSFFDRKEKAIPVWLVAVYAASFVIANLVVFEAPVDLLAMIASLTFVMCVGQKNGAKYRIWTTFNIGLWILYGLLKPAYPALLTHIPFLIFTLVGMIIHDREAKKAE